MAPRCRSVMSSKSLLAFLALLLYVNWSQALIRVSSPKSLEEAFKFDEAAAATEYGGGGGDEGGAPTDATDSQANTTDKLHPLDLFLEDILPTWLGQKPNNQNGTQSQFREFALKDISNDDASRLTSQELLARSGFRYETHDAVADDGYITLLTHIINPRADPAMLRRPPVLMEHGGSIDPSVYLVSSSIQHFPEPWPRQPADGPMRSWNRSLAFQLANNGFDVWLAESRGSNPQNRRRVRKQLDLGALFERAPPKPLETNHLTNLYEQLTSGLKSLDYWAFSQDDIIEHELKSHIDTVLGLTNSSELNLFTYSLSAPTSLAFLGMRPDYASKVRGYVSMAPIISGEGTSLFTNLLFKQLCSLLPDELGTIVVTDMIFSQPFRELLILLYRNKQVRYSLFKTITTLLMGPSPKWQTLIELNVIGHLFRELSFRELKQMCQQMSSNRLQKFDYGPLKNQLVYKQPRPPVYNISDLHITNWILVSASNDALATPKVVDHLLSIVNPKPIAHIVAPNFNHLDLFAGWENDIYVNDPIMHYLMSMSRYPGETPKSRGRGLDLQSFMPEFLHPDKFIGQARNLTKQILPPSPLEPKEFAETLSKGIKTFIETFAAEFSSLIFPKMPLLGGIGGLIKKPAKKESELVKSETGDKKQAPDAVKKPLDQLISGLKVPAIEKLTKNVSALFDPKQMISSFGLIYNSLGGAAASATAPAGGGDKKSNPLGEILEGFKLYKGIQTKPAKGDADEERAKQEAKDNKPILGAPGKILDGALKGLTGSKKTEADRAKSVLDKQPKLDETAAMMKGLASAAAGAQAMKSLTDTLGKGLMVGGGGDSKDGLAGLSKSLIGPAGSALGGLTGIFNNPPLSIKPQDK